MQSLVSTFALLFSLSLSLSACAHPNYQEAAAETSSGKATTCHLRFQSFDMCADLNWEVQPTESDTGTFVVHFTNSATNAPMDPALPLKVLLWMPSMGHGSSPVEVNRLSTGSYRVSRVYFSMPGTWQIRFQFKRGETLVEEQIETIQF